MQLFTAPQSLHIHITQILSDEGLLLGLFDGNDKVFGEVDGVFEGL